MEERVEVCTINNIQVTSHIPLNVSESVKRNRINRIYDILVAAEKNNKEVADSETGKSA